MQSCLFALYVIFCSAPASLCCCSSAQLPHVNRLTRLPPVGFPYAVGGDIGLRCVNLQMFSPPAAFPAGASQVAILIMLQALTCPIPLCPPAQTVQRRCRIQRVIFCAAGCWLLAIGFAFSLGRADSASQRPSLIWFQNNELVHFAMLWKCVGARRLPACFCVGHRYHVTAPERWLSPCYAVETQLCPAIHSFAHGSSSRRLVSTNVGPGRHIGVNCVLSCHAIKSQ